MKRYLFVLLLLGLICFAGYGQDENIYYKIKFDSYAAFDYPCNDGDDGYEYYNYSEVSNATFTVNGITFNEGEEKDFTDSVINVTVIGSGTTSVTYLYRPASRSMYIGVARRSL